MADRPAETAPPEPVRAKRLVQAEFPLVETGKGEHMTKFTIFDETNAPAESKATLRSGSSSNFVLMFAKLAWFPAIEGLALPQ